VVTVEQALQATEETAAATFAAARIATTARLTSAAGFTAAALLATTARLTTVITTTTAQTAEERIRATGRSEHQGDGKRRKGRT
jgi:hypothetical protein